MNERIQKLAEQAVLQANEVFDQKGKDYPGIVMEKFAELIVRECAGINLKSPFKDGEFHAREILEHFGVDE
jgi:hypothetical protein